MSATAKDQDRERTPVLRRQAVELLVVFLAYAAVAVWWLWPLPMVWRDHTVDVGSRMDLTGADFDLIAWALAWASHVAVHPSLSLFDAPIFYPARGALAFSEHALGYLPLFAPVYWWTHNAVLAANLTLFATFPLCGLAMYALARRFTSPPAAFVAGFVFAFCSIRYNALWHLHLLGTFWVPLAVLATERLLERGRWRDAGLLFLALTFQCLSSYYLAYALALLYGPYAVLALWRWRSEIDRRRLWAWGLACAAAGATFVVVSLPYFALQGSGLLPDYRDGTWVFSDVWPADARRRWVAYLSPQNLGVAVAALIALGALVPPRRSRYARWVGLLALASGLIFAAGPEPRIAGQVVPTPYNLLTASLPGFQAIRGPWRFLVVTQFGAALLAALGVERLSALVSGKGRVLCTLAVLLLVGAGSWGWRPLRVHAKPDLEHPPPALVRLAASDVRAPLVEIPMVGDARAASRMLAATTHWLPTIGGYSGYPPPIVPFFKRVTAGLPADAALQRLVDLVDVGWILVHQDELGPRGRARWSQPLPSGLTVEGRWGGDLLLRVTRAPRTDARSRLLSRSQTPDGVSLAPLGESCPGQIIVGPPSKRTAAPGRRLGVAVALHNDARRSWPAFGVFADRLVRIDATLEVAADGRPLGRPKPIHFDADLGPGDTASAWAWVTLPKTPGLYRLEFTAFQGDRSLEACGVASRSVEIRVANPRDVSRRRALRRAASRPSPRRHSR